MTEKQGIDIVRQWYDTLDRSLMAPDVVWEIAEGFPQGGIYKGHEEVFGEFFPRLQNDFSTWNVKLQEVIDAGAIVVGLGSYQAQARVSGIQVDVPFAHIWKVKGGKIVSLRQYTDTLLFWHALSGIQ